MMPFMPRLLALFALAISLWFPSTRAHAADPISTTIDALQRPDDRRHVIVDGASPAAVGGLFPGQNVAVESTTFTTVPWRPIDAVVFGPTRLNAASSLVGPLLANGTRVLVQTDARPPGPWPWERTVDGWLARYDIVGPSRFVAPAVYDSADLRPIGRPDNQRRNVVLLATLFSLCTIGLAIAVRGRHTVVTIVGFSVLACGGLIAWASQQSVIRETRAVIIVQSGSLQQVDLWTFQRSPAPIDEQVDATVTGWPVLRSRQHAMRSGVNVIDAPNGPQVAYRVDRGVPMVLLNRTIESSVAIPEHLKPIDVRWRALASQYRERGVELMGVDEASGDAVTIWLRLVR